MTQKRFVSMIGALIIIIGAVALITGCLQPNSNKGNTGNNSGNISNNGGNTGNNSENTGNTGGNTGNNSENTSNNGGNTGNDSENTGNTGGNTGNNSENTSNNGGNTGNDSENTGNTGGNTGSDSENTGNNSGNTGGNTGGNTDNGSSSTPTPEPTPNPEPAPNPEPSVPDEPEIEPDDVPVPSMKDDWITLSKDENYLIIRWYVRSEEEPDSYNIYRSETKNGDYVCIKKEYSGSSKDLGTYVRCEYDETSADIKTSGKSYYYRISAVCQGVEGKQSEPKGITITPPKAYATGGQCRIEGVLLPSKAKDSIVISENNRDYKTRYKKKNGEWSKWVYWTYDENFKPLFTYEIDCKTGVVYYDTSQMIRFEK